MSDDALILRTVDENDPLDNERGVTYRVKQETGTPDNKRGVTYRVKNVGGGSATIDPLSITPSTSAQTITASGGTDGYSPVNVAAVDASIDANIVAGNIKKDVSILGVTGSYEGTTPTGTMYIISNGTYNVADKAIANVQVPTTAPAYYIEKNVNASGELIGSGSTMMDWTGVNNVKNNFAFAYAYVNSTLSGAITIGNNTEASGVSCFYNCFAASTSITSAVVSITKLSGNTCCQQMFSGCNALQTVDWSALTTVTAQNTCWNVFVTCDNLLSVNLNGLVIIDQPLSPSYGQFFGSGCLKVESVTFGGLKASTFANRQNQLQYLFYTNTGSQAPNGCTVHFPSNFDPSDPNHTFDASTLAGYPTFGGNASYIHVAFDLPATE